jgi:hypothetical protein
LSNNQDLRWGSSTATSILGSSAGGGDLTLNAADDVFLNPMDDLFVQANNATYAAFDGGAYRLGLDSDASVGHYATTLTVRGDVNATTATSFVANVVNKNTGAYVRVLKLAVGRSSDSTTAFFVRAFQNDAVGNGSGTLKWYVRSDGVTPDTFTGKHYVIYEAEPGGRAELELEPGFIVETAGRIWSERRVDQCLPVVRLCRTPACKKVFGVVAPDWKADRDFHIWSECAEALHPDSQADVNEAEGTVEPATVPFDPASRLFKGRVNSVGEGMVWVTDAAGPVEEGDYITSSAIPGHGARQEDDLLHSYTVAKCTEAPDWSKAEAIPFEAGFVRRLLVACTYHCG